MALISLKNICKEYSGKEVLRNVSCEVAPGQKIGLIGANGSGKTTLLRILCGQVQPGQGKVDLSPLCRIGYVPQHVSFGQEQTALDYLMEPYRTCREQLQAAEKQLAAADPNQAKQVMEHYQQARDRYDQIGGDPFESRCRATVQAMGLAQQLDQPIRLLSGGERNVLGLTAALLNDPTLLVLDEPGNHLDYMGLAWLDDFLSRFRGSVLIVSHNRYLLDRIAGGIFELEDGKLTTYPGNYSDYQILRRQRLEQLERQYHIQQERISHLEGLVRKFADIAQGHASDATWGKRLRARRSQLEKARSQAIEKPISRSRTVHADFSTEATRSDIALQLRRYKKSFPPPPDAQPPGSDNAPLVLFETMDWDIQSGQRWALVGPNGCGKTTLLRDIIQHGSWEHKHIRIGPSLTIGYCAQQQETLHSDRTVYEELFSVAGTTGQQVLDILARFLFRDEEVNKNVCDLSGGERNRLQLAKLMLEKPNFLILDEPTNHLDIPTREAVEQALLEFQGTLLVVSHDRYFLDKIVGHVAQVQDRKLSFYTGDFTKYWQQCHAVARNISGRISLRGKLKKQNEPKEKDKPGGAAWKQRKALTSAVRKAQTQLSDIERNIDQLEQKKSELEARVAEAFSQQDIQTGHQLSRELDAVSRDLQKKYTDWESAEKELKQTQEDLSANQPEGP